MLRSSVFQIAMGLVVVSLTLHVMPGALFAASALNLEDVDSTAASDFTDKPFNDGVFSTEFDGKLTPGFTGTVLFGDAAGNLTMGGSSNAMLEYTLDFDDAIEILITGREDNGSNFGTFGDSDSFMISSPGVDFVFSDSGDADLANITNINGSISFTGISNAGDGDWSINTNGPVSTLVVKFTSTTGGGNRSTLNFEGSVVPLPAAAWMAFPLLGGVGVTQLIRRRRLAA